MNLTISKQYEQIESLKKVRSKALEEMHKHRYPSSSYNRAEAKYLKVNEALTNKYINMSAEGILKNQTLKKLDIISQQIKMLGHSIRDCQTKKMRQVEIRLVAKLQALYTAETQTTLDFSRAS